MRWHVQNFKGINQASLDLSEGIDTVITGVNSSGKSSVIQSLLLAAQSLYNPGPLVLNGPLVRLGTAEDLVREGTAEQKVILGIDNHFGNHVEVENDNLRIRYELAPTDDKSSLAAAGLSISLADKPGISLQLSSALSRKQDSQNALKVTDLQRTGVALHLKSLLNDPGRLVRTYLVMQGLRPIAFYQAMRSDEMIKLYKRVVSAAFSQLEKENFDADWGSSNQMLFSGYVKEFITLIRRHRGELSEDLREAVKALSAASNGNPYRFAMIWKGIDKEISSRLIELAAVRRGKRSNILLHIGDRSRRSFGRLAGDGILETDLRRRLGSSFEAINAVDGTVDDVANRVQYLGPLRDEPRVVWNHWNEIAQGLPVGTRGEYSAALLSRKGRMLVDFYAPNGEEEVDTLGGAVNLWLEHLDIGQSVSARSEGKLGVGLELRVDGRKRDLTQVGVGVSQALPLVVGLLAAPFGSIFIVEQPELHLHPAVQARLADFLMSARPDVSVVVETHSESFVTRIRRQVAEEVINPENVHIIFVEPRGNGSVGRRLTLTAFGDLNEWPKGFLTSAEEDIRAILQANVTRARRGTPND